MIADGRLAAWCAALLLAVLVPTFLLMMEMPPRLVSSVEYKCYIALTDVFTFMLGYAILIGLPTALAFYYLRWTHPLAALAGGLALGTLAAALLSDPYLCPLGMMAAVVFWGTLKSCGALMVNRSRPRVSMALAGLSILLTGLSVWAIPICLVGG
jgi:hypothetical protein